MCLLSFTNKILACRETHLNTIFDASEFHIASILLPKLQYEGFNITALVSATLPFATPVDVALIYGIKQVRQVRSKIRCVLHYRIVVEIFILYRRCTSCFHTSIFKLYPCNFCHTPVMSNS